MRWGRIGAGVVIAGAFIGAVVLLGNYLISWRYDYTQPAADYPKPASAVQAQLDDLGYLQHLPEDDWSYTDKTRAEALAVIDDAVHRVIADGLNKKRPMKPGEFELVVARVNALADNGHTNVWAGARANRLIRLPIRVYSFADGVYIVRARSAEKSLLGARILAVDGHPIAQVAKTVSVYTGGTADEKNARLPFYLEAPQLLRAAGVANAYDRVALTLAMPDGSSETHQLIGDPPDAKAPKLWPSEELTPGPIKDEGPDWISALKGKADFLPMFAGDPKPFFDSKLPDNAYYLRFDVNHDDGKTSITDYAKAALARAVAAKPDIVIVDLRMNGGGDYTTTADFMRGLPKALPNAKIYILLSQETFSAGMTSAAFLKQAAGDRGFFVGGPPGDRIRFHAEGGDFCLPFSGICMGVRTGMHDYSTTDCRPFFECYALNRFYPVAIKSFAPDIEAPLTYEALSHGHDPAMDAIFASVAH